MDTTLSLQESLRAMLHEIKAVIERAGQPINYVSITASDRDMEHMEELLSVYVYTKKAEADSGVILNYSEGKHKC